jgi:hypothetical protein
MIAPNTHNLRWVQILLILPTGFFFYWLIYIWQGWANIALIPAPESILATIPEVSVFTEVCAHIILASHIASIILIGRNNRLYVVTLFVAAITHTAAWIDIASLQHYDGGPGLAILLIEYIALVTGTRRLAGNLLTRLLDT